ncbi:HU family DNA-binding protein [Mycoplasma marinum]|uniref:DNA-binding protein HU n=1 Tax=Mycoplasma marinum TaxID=1937190 RepID=A0A4R0XN62_9MOLU|nr:HU family DNA-binding protein [Mycoplasma marinum]TCG12002.1 DNA-binding protein HU [Mycoplasma marinum]
MNKAELIEEISRKSNLTKADAERALNSLIETITSSVNEGVKVTVAGLGTFERVSRAARVGINPQTKEKIQIAAKNAPKFKPAKVFKELVA